MGSCPACCACSSTGKALQRQPCKLRLQRKPGMGKREQASQGQGPCPKPFQLNGPRHKDVSPNASVLQAQDVLLILTIGFEPIIPKEQILNLPCLPFHQVSIEAFAPLNPQQRFSVGAVGREISPGQVPCKKGVRWDVARATQPVRSKAHEGVQSPLSRAGLAQQAQLAGLRCKALPVLLQAQQAGQESQGRFAERWHTLCDRSTANTQDYKNLSMMFESPPSKDHHLLAGGFTPKREESSTRKPSFLYYHWLEARDRTSYLVFSFAITFSICYIHSLELIFFYVKPFLSFERSFIFTELTEALYVTLEICIITTLCVVFPLFCYQAWGFFVPSLYNLERRGWSLFLLISTLLSLLALLSVYALILPCIAAVLLQFEIKSQILTIQLEARIDSYVDWSSKVFLAVLLYGQLPLLSYMGFCLGFLSPDLLIRRRRVLLALSMVTAALLSPPDLFTQWLVTVFILFWIEAIIWLGMVSKRREALATQGGHI